MDGSGVGLLNENEGLSVGILVGCVDGLALGRGVGWIARNVGAWLGATVGA
jgi:hypothetical protein